MNRSQRRAAMKNGKRNRATIVPNRTKKQEKADFSDIPLATVCRSIQLLIDELKDRGIRIYDFDNKEIAKVEIKAKDLKKAKVELEYTIVVENIGNIEGYVEKLVDYLGNDLAFEESDNSIWYLGNDGKLYTKNLDNTSLKPGEKRELKLKLK